MSKEFPYSQRPFSKQLTDEEYDLAVGRVKPITYDRDIVRKLERELEDEARKTNIFVRHDIPALCPFTENPSINPHGCYVSDDGENGPSPNWWVVHGRTCPRAE